MLIFTQIRMFHKKKYETYTILSIDIVGGGIMKNIVSMVEAKKYIFI